MKRHSAERSGRRNRLFLGDAEAGHRSAVLYTIIESCRDCGDSCPASNAKGALIVAFCSHAYERHCGFFLRSLASIASSDESVGYAIRKTTRTSISLTGSGLRDAVFRLAASHLGRTALVGGAGLLHPLWLDHFLNTLRGRRGFSERLWM